MRRNQQVRPPGRLGEWRLREWLRAWLRPDRSLLADTALAVVLAGLGSLATVGAGQGAAETHRAVGPLALALVASTGLVLAVRRRWPVVTLAVATVTTTGYLLLSYPYGPVLVLFAVAVYTVAAQRPLARAVPAAAAALVLLLTHVPVNDAALSGWRGLIAGAAWVAVPFAVGVTVRARREEAARARAEVIRSHVDDERLRVAQEVHDVVGHGLAAIKMQADVALHVLAKQPERAERREQAQSALDAISRTSSEALTELRATLAVVRGGDGDPERAPTPMPRLAGLDELRHRMASAGLQVRVATTGEPRTLPTGVDLAGYRLVQESLTNVLRHGGAARDAEVAVRYEPDAVDLTVSNPVDRPQPAAGGDGLGIAGMRQRVEALGGTFTAGPDPAGDRFVVHARLPTGNHS